MRRERPGFEMAHLPMFQEVTPEEGDGGRLERITDYSRHTSDGHGSVEVGGGAWRGGL